MKCKCLYSVTPHSVCYLISSTSKSCTLHLTFEWCIIWFPSFSLPCCTLVVIFLLHVNWSSGCGMHVLHFLDFQLKQNKVYLLVSFMKIIYLWHVKIFWRFHVGKYNFWSWLVLRATLYIVPHTDYCVGQHCVIFWDFV